MESALQNGRPRTSEAMTALFVKVATGATIEAILTVDMLIDTDIMARATKNTAGMIHLSSPTQTPITLNLESLYPKSPNYILNR